MTSVAANEAVMRSDRAIPGRLGWPGPPTISPTPARATTMASQVRRETGSPNTVPSTAARIGASACMKRTLATDEWFSATMNEPEEIAISAAIASPPRPTDRNARSTAPCSATATYASSPSTAKRARPASCVPTPTDSSRCKIPAVDHATAASATMARPRRCSVTERRGEAMPEAIDATLNQRGRPADLLRRSAPLAAPKRIDPSACLLRRPRAEVGAERAGEAALEPLALALGERVGRLPVERGRDARGAAAVGDVGDHDRPAELASPNPDRVADPDLLRRLHPLPAHLNVAAEDGLGRRAASLEGPRGPQPLVDPNPLHRVIFLHTPYASREYSMLPVGHNPNL